MFDPMWKAVPRLERLGFCAPGLSCEGALNHRLWKLHNSKNQLVYKVPNLQKMAGNFILYQTHHIYLRQYGIVSAIQREDFG